MAGWRQWALIQMLSLFPPSFLRRWWRDEKDRAGGWSWGCNNLTPSLSEDHPLPSSSLSVTAPNFAASILPQSYCIHLLTATSTHETWSFFRGWGSRSAPLLLIVWTICASRASVDINSAAGKRTTRPPHPPKHPPHPQHPCRDVQRSAPRTGRHIKRVKSVRLTDSHKLLHRCIS